MTEKSIYVLFQPSYELDSVSHNFYLFKKKRKLKRHHFGSDVSNKKFGKETVKIDERGKFYASAPQGSDVGHLLLLSQTNKLCL